MLRISNFQKEELPFQDQDWKKKSSQGPILQVLPSM